MMVVLYHGFDLVSSETDGFPTPSHYLAAIIKKLSIWESFFIIVWTK
jgi:hypothetical protein